MSTIWHYQIGSASSDHLSERSTVEAADWIGAMGEVTKIIKELGLEPNEIYVWHDEA